MKRIARIIFSRISIVSISIILQFALWILAFNYLENVEIFNLNLVQLIVTFSSLFLLLFIINKKQDAVYKMPWILLVLIFPVVGLVSYLVFGRFPISKRQQRKQELIRDEIISSLKQDDLIISSLEKESLNALGQSKYITNVSSMPLLSNTKTKYLASGKEFFEELKNILNKAKEYIFMEYFILAEGKMLDEILEILYLKASQGVKIYFLHDDIGSMGRISLSKIKEMRNKGIHASIFNPFIPIVSIVHNNRDHRKITVVDGMKGLIGGVNIGDEYIDLERPYGYWKDSSMLLEGSGVNSLIALFVQNYNMATYKNKLSAKDFYVNHEVKIDNGFVQPFGDGPRPIDHHHIGENVYLNLINNAKKSICITTPYLIVSYSFLLALANASRRGIDVRIVTPYIPDKKIVNILTKSNYKMLVEAGVKIYEYKPGFIHAKNFIVDNKYAVCGTINLDYRSFVHHYECGVWMYKTNAIEEMQKDFDQIIEKEGLLITNEMCKLSFIKRIIKELINIFAPLL